MSTFTLNRNYINKPCTTPTPTILNDHIYNLIQYFYVIGVDCNTPFNDSFYDIYDTTSTNHTIHNSIYTTDNDNNDDTDITTTNNNSHLKTFPPKVISKYPNTDLPYLSIANDIIASHAFPNGITPITNESTKVNENFIFSFTNQNPINPAYHHCKLNRIYFTCFLFYEKLSTYAEYFNMKYPSIPHETPSYLNNIYIPKILCVCSFIPLHYSFYKLLHMIRDYTKCSNELTFPLEKVIEHVVFSIPTPPRGLVTINYTYEQSKHITIELPACNELSNADNDLLTLINNLTIEQIFQMIKCLLLEIPLLVFCKDSFILTNIVEALPTLITPIEYVYPIIAMLPSINVSLLQSLSAFIIGINDVYYEGYFTDRQIELGNKHIVIVHINAHTHTSDIIYHKQSTNQPLVTLFNNPNFEYIPPKDLFILNLPLHYTQKTINNIKAMLTIHKTQGDAFAKRNFNMNIRQHFYNYFVCILLYYQDYIIKSNMICSNVYDKYLKRELMLSELIDVKEFLRVLPKLDRVFYKAFFETNLFFNFIAKKVFPFTLHDKLDIILFDEYVNTKLNKKIINGFKKKTTPFIASTAFHKQQHIDITAPYIDDALKTQTFTQDEINFISTKTGTNRLISYFQRITTTTHNQMVSIMYTMFPKLINDGVYFNNIYTPTYNTSTYISITYNNTLLHTYTTLESICNEFIKNNAQLHLNYKNVNYSITQTCMNNVDVDCMLYTCMLWSKMIFAFVHELSLNERRKLFKEFKKMLLMPVQYYNQQLTAFLFMKVLKYGNTELAKLFYIQSKGKTYLNCLSLREKIRNNFSKELRESSYTCTRSVDTSLMSSNACGVNGCTCTCCCMEVVFEQVVKCVKCKGEFDIGKDAFIERFNKVNVNIKEMSFVCKYCDQYNVINVNCVVKRSENDNYEKICFNLLSCVYLFHNECWVDMNGYCNRKDYMRRCGDAYWSCVFYFAMYNLPYKFMFPLRNVTHVQSIQQNVQINAVRCSEVSSLSLLK